MTTNGVKHIVPLDKIVSGGPSKDAIPSIDHPTFVDASAVDHFLPDEDLVFGLYYEGEARAYPAMILVWHEIVNDIVNGKPVLVTYCPLCYASAAYERVIDGEPVEFGVSGKLYQSDLVMYDRKTDSYWSQILGKAIVGELAGRELTRIPIDQTTWGVWKKLHPDTKVLSMDTGFRRPYGTDPYDGYYTSDVIVFPVDYRDERLHPKAVVYGLALGADQKAYSVETVWRLGAVNDRVGGMDLVVLSTVDQGPLRVFDRHLGEDLLEFVVKNGRIFDTKTNSEWNFDGVAVSGPLAGRALSRVVGITCFWFAWATFYPRTLLVA